MRDLAATSARAPAPKAAEHPVVQEEHDGARHEEGAHGGVHHKVVVLQLAHAGVAPRHPVEAEDDGAGHHERQHPGGGDEGQLAHTELVPVVFERHHHGDVSVKGKEKEVGGGAEKGSDESIRPGINVVTVQCF